MDKDDLPGPRLWFYTLTFITENQGDPFPQNILELWKSPYELHRAQPFGACVCLCVQCCYALLESFLICHFRRFKIIAPNEGLVSGRGHSSLRVPNGCPDWPQTPEMWGWNSLTFWLGFLDDWFWIIGFVIFTFVWLGDKLNGTLQFLILVQLWTAGNILGFIFFYLCERCVSDSMALVFCR